MDLTSLKRQLEITLAQVSVAVRQERKRADTNKDNSDTLSDAFSALEALQNSLPPLDDAFDRFHCQHDGRVHNPLGAGSYLYKNNYIPSLFRYCGLPSESKINHDGECVSVDRVQRPTTIIIHIGAQPNNSLHAGTIVVFALAFLIGREMRQFHRSQCETGNWQFDLQVRIQLDLVDTAPDNQQTLLRDGVVYQRSQRDTQAMQRFLPDYEYIAKSLFEFVDRQVPYTIENQETLMEMPCIPRIVSTIVKDQERLGAELSPEFGTLALRSACPHPGCGYAEKHGRENVYSTVQGGEMIISFKCPDHGCYSISLSDPASVKKLEFNTPLRNLTRALAYGVDMAESQMSGEGTAQRVHMRVTGADYAGMYQEQLLWRQLGILPAPFKTQPLIVYAPLIVDWAGSKLSKSLYVEPNAYRYLREQNMDYLLSYERMKECNRDEKVLFQEVERWLQEPRKLFRSFSIEYIHSVFEKNIH